MELTEARGHDIQSWKRYVPSFHHHHQPPPSPTGRRPTFTAVRWNFHGPDIYSTPLHRFSIFSPLQLRFSPGLQHNTEVNLIFGFPSFPADQCNFRSHLHLQPLCAISLPPHFFPSRLFIRNATAIHSSRSKVNRYAPHNFYD